MSPTSASSVQDVGRHTSISSHILGSRDSFEFGFLLVRGAFATMISSKAIKLFVALVACAFASEAGRTNLDSPTERGLEEVGQEVSLRLSNFCWSLLDTFQCLSLEFSTTTSPVVIFSAAKSRR
jgi:hypothetical protein